MAVLKKKFTFPVDRLNTFVIHLQGAVVYLGTTKTILNKKENYHGNIFSRN